MRRARTLLLCAALAGPGCGADPAPAVTVLGTSPQMPQTIDPAQPGKGDVTIRVRYREEDGDLGGGAALVHDCRDEGLVTRLPIPPIASPAAVQKGVTIQGELDLHVRRVARLEPAAQAPAACAARGVGAPRADQVVFCVALVDAAGHQGDADCTAPIGIAAATP